MAEPSDWITRLKELGPWIVSFLALAQVWLIALWRRLRAGRLEIYESGTIEIGYGNFGPSINLNGTIRCKHKDVFIKRARIQLKRLKDGAQHDFAWRAFRPSTISLSPTANVELELASSFLVTSTQPHRYNIFFVDDKFIAEHRAKVEPIAQKWLTFALERLATLVKENPGSLQNLGTDSTMASTFFSEFSKQPEVRAAYAALDRAVYWEEGEYSLALEFECAEPRRSFSKVWRFRLGQADADRLRLNSVSILQATCGLQAKYNFAYPEYIEEKKE